MRLMELCGVAICCEPISTKRNDINNCQENVMAHANNWQEIVHSPPRNLFMNPAMKKTINPVLRSNLLNIVEKIQVLHPSHPHCLMLQQSIQKAFFFIKKSGLPESEQLLPLFTHINCNGVGSYDSGIFLRVQREALSIISGVLEGELVRPA